MSHSPAKILIIRGGAVGDFILTLPAIQLIKDQLPHLEIEVLGYPAIAELSVAAGLVDRVSSIEDGTLAHFFVPNAKLDDSVCHYLASFNVVVSYIYDPDDYFSENLLRAGVQTLLKGPYQMSEDSPFVPAAKQLALPLEGLALYLDDAELQKSFTSKPKISNRIWIHPGSGSPKKNWSFENWAAFMKRVQSTNPELQFCLSCGEAELERIGDLESLLKKESIRYQLFSGLTLTELAEEIQQAQIYIGHDSGISHLAALTGTSAILLFGPTNPDIWAPANSWTQIYRAPDYQLGSLSPDQLYDRFVELFTAY
ncbi:MAG: glycosyltransferase family 9 protein [Verrucomicrobiota bacterium]